MKGTCISLSTGSVYCCGRPVGTEGLPQSVGTLAGPELSISERPTYSLVPDVTRSQVTACTTWLALMFQEKGHRAARCLAVWALAELRDLDFDWVSKVLESIPSQKRDLQASDILFPVASSLQRIREGAGSSRVPAATASWSVYQRGW